MRKVFAIFLLFLFIPIYSGIALAADTNIPFRFIAWADSRGDSGSTVDSATLSGLAGKINGLSPAPAFTIFPGDLCNSFSTTCVGTDWKNALGTSLFGKTFATRGNHDSGNDAGWQSTFESAAVAANVGATNYRAQTADLTYSFDYGNSHFVGIDMPGGDISSMSSSLITWLDNDLTAAESRGITHTFLFWHGPVYWVDGHQSDPPPSLITTLNNHSSISAAFFGHEHVITYTRINGSRISSVTHPFEEFISGSAGAPAYSATRSRVDYCLEGTSSSCPQRAGFMAVDVSGNIFNVSVYTTSGTLDKVFTFIKTIYINGTVKDNATNAPIKGVTVSTNTSASTTTDASGFYSLTVTTGTHQLTARLEPVYYTNSSITVTAGSDAVVVQDIELVKKPMGTITGSVTVG